VTGALALSGVQPPSPTTFIIDTSVAIKWYLPEICQSEAQRFLDPMLDRHAPDLLHAELGSVLLKKVRRREINVDECRMYLGRLSAVPLISHEALPLRQVALEIGLQIGSSFYDGLFLALALQLGGRLVTADNKLYRKIQGSPFDPWAFWIADSL
jgi:predicted nucleic acid-binding protein